MLKNFLKILILIAVVSWFLWNKTLSPVSATLTASISVDVSKNLGNIQNVLGVNLNGAMFRETTNPESLKQILINQTKDILIKTIRYPNGCHADRYNWKEPWGFSVAEFVKFSRQAGAEPYWVLNIQREHTHHVCALPKPVYRYRGTIEEAADLVEYANAPNDGSNPNGGRRWALVRASPPEYCRQQGLNEKLCANHSKPFNIKYWEISNEPWAAPDGSSQFNNFADQAKNYASVANKLAKKLKEVDPNIELILTASVINKRDPKTWNKALEEEPGLLSIVDRIKEHIYYGGSGGEGKSLVFIQANINYFIKELKRLFPNKSIDITEWNGLIHEPTMMETLEHGLFTARMIEAFIEQGVKISHYHHLNGVDNFSLILFKSNQDLSYYLPPSYYAFSLFGNHFGPILVSTNTQSPTFNYNDPTGNCRINSKCAPSTNNVPYLTAITSKDNDSSKVYLIVINGHPSENIQTSVSVTNLPFDSAQTAAVFTLNGPAMNSKNDADHPDRVKISKSNLAFSNPGKTLNFNYSFPAHSVTAIEISRKPSLLLSSGWNEIVWPDISNLTAKSALEDIDNDCGVGTAIAIAIKRKDWWKDYVKNFGGRNFNLQNNQNYHIKVSKDCNWVP